MVAWCGQGGNNTHLLSDGMNCGLGFFDVVVV